MSLFFLVIAVFFIPAQVSSCLLLQRKILQADDLGPYGNYTGTCSLRPVNAQKLQYVTCIPSRNKAFTFDDSFWIGGYVPRDQSIAWDVSLLSSTYQILFQARFQGKKLNVRFNTSPWGSKNVWMEIPPSPTASPFTADQTFYIKIINTPKGIQVEWLLYSIRYNNNYSSTMPRSHGYSSPTRRKTRPVITNIS